MQANSATSVRAQKIASLAQELVQEGVLTSDQVAVAMESQKNLGGDLAEILIRRGFLSEKDINERLAKKAGVATASLSDFQPDVALLKTLSVAQANRWRIVPVAEDGAKLTVATADPFNLSVLDEVRAELGREIDLVLVQEKEIAKIIQEHYGMEAVPESASKDGKQGKPKGRPALQVEGDAGGTVAAVDEMLEKAYRERASDVHIEPTREGLKVRLRIDGMLESLIVYPQAMQQTILSRIKILGGMDVAEHRIPQDGRTRLKIDGKDMDIRIATYPTIYGEAAAIRMLSRDSSLSLESMGFLGNDLEMFEKIIRRPHGIFLVTGPTGSGKTTTLYTALQRIDRAKHHVLTVEDPVENEIEGADQTQINPKAGLTFAAVLRAMMREDPDIIMVGEIRDQETAEISVRAAMTGHLVLSTLHTNSAIGAIARLQDLGLETFLISSTLLGVMAQRLVRRICQSCKESVPVSPEAVQKFGFRAQGMQAFVGRGCGECSMRGYKGRIGLFELIAIDEEFRVLINNHSPEIRLREKASAAGSRSIIEDGIEKIKLGMTTVEEVLRVCGDI